MRLNSLRVVSATLVVVAASFGQTAHVANLNGFNSITEDIPVLNNACGLTTSQIPFYPSGGPLAITAGAILGGHALDQVQNLVYTTDGFWVDVAPNPLYAPTPCTFIPLSFAIPPVVGVFGTLVGPITGMCVGHQLFTSSPSGPCPDLLFMTDGIQVMAVDPRFPLFAVVGPWLASTLIPGQILTGLEYDFDNNHVVAVDAAGFTYLYTTVGTPVGGPIPPNITGWLGPIVGNVLDRSVCPNAHYVTDGVDLWEVATGSGPYPLNPPPGTFAVGASFSAEPVLLRGACGSICNPTVTITTTEPVVGLKPAVFTLSGAPAFTPTLFVLDFFCTPGLGLPPGCVWWMTLGPWWFTATPATNATGDATVNLGNIPFASCPGLVGLTLYAQWFYVDTCAGNGWGITDAMHLRLSTP